MFDAMYLYVSYQLSVCFFLLFFLNQNRLDCPFVYEDKMHINLKAKNYTITISASQKHPLLSYYIKCNFISLLLLPPPQAASKLSGLLGPPAGCTATGSNVISSSMIKPPLPFFLLKSATCEPAEPTDASQTEVLFAFSPRVLTFPSQSV